MKLFAVRPLGHRPRSVVALSLASFVFSGLAPAGVFSGLAPAAVFSGLAPAAVFSGLAPAAVFSGLAPAAVFLGLAPAAVMLAPAAFAQTPPAPPADATPKPDTVLAIVNGRSITQADLTLAAEDIGPNMPAQLTGKAKDAYLLDYLIDGNLVAQKAASDKADKTPEFAQKLAYAKDKLLMESILTKIAKSATSDESMHKIYEEAAKAQKPEEEIHARHVLVATEGDAQAVLKRLKAGEDFAKVAKEMSKDPGSEGGDLGWFTKERMVPAFADAAFKLKEGEISQPVKSQFGWHIIQLQGRRQKVFPPFEQVKDQIARYAVQKAQSDLILTLRKDAKIERTAAAPPADGPVVGEAPAEK